MQQKQRLIEVNKEYIRMDSENISQMLTSIENETNLRRPDIGYISEKLSKIRKYIDDIEKRAETLVKLGDA